MRINLPQIDWYKAILGVITLTFGSLLIVTTLIVPYIREIQKQNVILNVEKTSHDKAKARFEEESARLGAFKKENSHIIAGFHNRFSSKAFVSGFGGASLLEFTAGSKGEEKVYSVDDYSVTAGFDGPKKLFELLKTFDEANFIAQITYPVVIASKNGALYSSFGIKTFVLIDTKTKRKPSVEEGKEPNVNQEEQGATAPEEAATETKTPEAKEPTAGAPEEPKQPEKPAIKSAKPHGVSH